MLSLGQCKARPINYYQVCLFISSLFQCPQHIIPVEVSVRPYVSSALAHICLQMSIVYFHEHTLYISSHHSSAVIALIWTCRLDRFYSLGH